MRKPLYLKVQHQLNRYHYSAYSPEAIADVLCTIAEALAKEHPHAAKRLAAEAELAHEADMDLVS